MVYFALSFFNASIARDYGLNYVGWLITSIIITPPVALFILIFVAKGKEHERAKSRFNALKDKYIEMYRSYEPVAKHILSFQSAYDYLKINRDFDKGKIDTTELSSLIDGLSNTIEHGILPAKYILCSSANSTELTIKVRQVTIERLILIGAIKRSDLESMDN
ncbi:hypothetical protein [Thaumasiovibrio subtropicus]|uniref:hypothetical protein n=1 Tax=Thaumasiovibrio subtropicus TaxID=1891207 RepID=UPI000B364AAF|nr:hypothetical protein [Thaumasiovibrio subtropicus]